LSLVINSNPVGLSGGDIVKTYESLRPKGFEGMPADFRELGPSYRAANPAGVKLWLELEHNAVTSNPFRQRAANAITEATLQHLQVPTLLITGEADLYSPPALIRMVAAQIPNSEVVIVREAGHSSYWEQPEAFNRAIDIRILRIRRKIEADPIHPTSIRTVRGVGYMFVPPED